MPQGSWIKFSHYLMLYLPRSRHRNKDLSPSNLFGRKAQEASVRVEKGYREEKEATVGCVWADYRCRQLDFRLPGALCEKMKNESQSYSLEGWESWGTCPLTPLHRWLTAAPRGFSSPQFWVCPVSKHRLSIGHSRRHMPESRMQGVMGTALTASTTLETSTKCFKKRFIIIYSYYFYVLWIFYCIHQF